MSPLGRRTARFNRRVTNHLTRPLAHRLPGFGIVVHTGRRSKRRYRTPVNVFAARGGYVIALTYGADTDWVKNVLAAGGCELETRGRVVHLARPEVFHDESATHVPPVVRQMLRLLGVSDFIRLETGASPSGRAESGAG